MKHLMCRTEDVINSDLWRLFPAINCDRVEDIPVDYPGPIGVPFTIMPKLNPAQFELIDLLRPQIGNKALFKRFIIRHLHPDLPEYIDIAEWLEKTGSDYCLEASNCG